MEILNEYIKKIEYYKSKGRGISIYNSESHLPITFINELNSRNISIKELSSSIIGDKSDEELNIKDFDLLIFYQDLKIKELKSVIDKIINKIIYSSFYLNIPIIYLSKLPKSDYEVKIEGDLVHSKYHEVVNNLLIEQLDRLMDQINYTFTSREFTNELDKNFYTPIEKIFRDQCIKSNIDFKSQVKFDIYYVDFLINYNGESAIVECDGKDYHNPNRDFERDKSLSRFNIPIIRFTGSELYFDSQSCLRKVLSQLSGQNTDNSFQLDQNLDDSQKAPINEISGPIRVLAPAGSGKTKTLTNRIINLVNQGINPNQILALAFNKRAATEMEERLNQKGITTAKKLSEEGVVVKTFHSFGFEIIRNSLNWSFNGTNESSETRRLMREIVDKIPSVPGWVKNETVDKFLEALRRSKLELPPIENYTIELNDGELLFGPYFRAYVDLQFSKNFFNFDDMVYLSLRILLEDNALRKTIQNRFNFLLIDEFQDLNQAQLLLMQIIALPTNNLFIVGDDDQMIYGFTGARVEHIVNFPERYAQSKDFTLSTNYRSAKKIVKHSSWLIKKNNHRVDKDINSYVNNSEGSFKVCLEDNLYNQAVQAVNWIKQIKESKNCNWKNFTVLFRYYEYQYPIAFVLDNEQIPHSPVNSQRLFLKKPGRDIYSYMTVILHPGDAQISDFSRILKRPNKYLNNNIIELARNWESFEQLVNKCEENNIILENWKIERIQGFIDQIKGLKSYANTTTSPYDIVSSIINEFELRNFYKDVANIALDVDVASDEVIMDVILSVSKSFQNINDFYEFIHDQINNPDANVNSVIEENPNRNEILISTIHKTKGNEFDNVVYFNLTQNDKVQSINEMEEERRVCYVGVTRAIEDFLITAPNGNYSNYLSELLRNPKFIEIEIENLVEQKNDLIHQINSKNNDISHNENQIDSIYDQFPELKGKSLQVNISMFTRKIESKIDNLFRKYPELKGAPLKKFPILNNFLSDRRVKKIEKAQIMIDNLNQEKEEIIENRKNERQEKVNSAKNRITEIEKNISSVRNKITELQKDTQEIEDELNYRNLLES